MAVLSLVYAPDPIFRQTSEAVAVVDDAIRALIDDLLETLEHEKGVGLAAPMVGVLKRIAVVDLRENDVPNPHCFINPEVIEQSAQTQSFEEASLCFPGTSAFITRPQSILLRYLDRDGVQQNLRAEGFFATVIQHELDYLDGRTFLDHLSKMKRDMCLKKMQKFLKHNPPHVHSEHCNH